MKGPSFHTSVAEEIRQETDAAAQGSFEPWHTHQARPERGDEGSNRDASKDVAVIGSAFQAAAVRRETVEA